MNFRPVISKLKLIAVEPILFLYMMIIFMETNAVQELIYVKSCITLKNPANISDCSSSKQETNQTDVTNLSAEWFKYYTSCWFLLTFFSTFYFGSWSDRFGRKRPMLIPPIGTFIAASLNAVLSCFIRSHMAFLLISSCLSGITFNYVGMIAATFGYVSDFTQEQSRTKRIAVLQSMTFIGCTIGIEISGLFLKNVHYEYGLNNFVVLYIFEATIAAAITVYIFFRIPNYSSESQAPHGPVTCSSLFSLTHVKDSLRTIFRFREGGKRTEILLMLAVLCLNYMGSTVQFTLGYYFLTTIEWSYDEYANLFSIIFAVEAIALISLSPLLYLFPMVPDHCICMLGLLSRFLGFTVFGFSALTAYSDYMVYSCIFWLAFSEYSLSAVRSILSKTVDSDETGRIFAFTTLLQNFCDLLGSFTLMTVFTESSFKGLSFELAAGIQGIAFIIVLYLFLIKRRTRLGYEAI